MWRWRWLDYIPTRLGVLAFDNPVTDAARIHEDSLQCTAHLTALIIKNEQDTDVMRSIEQNMVQNQLLSSTIELKLSPEPMQYRPAFHLCNKEPCPTPRHGFWSMGFVLM